MPNAKGLAPILIIVSTIIFFGFVGGVYYLGINNRPAKLDSNSTISNNTTPIPLPSAVPIPSILQQSVNQSIKVGIHEIKMIDLTNLYIRWTDYRDWRQANNIFINQYGYTSGELTKAYLVPNIGYSFPDYFKGKNAEVFLILHANFRDIRTEGGDRGLDTSQYFRIRKDQYDSVQILGYVHTIHPQENQDADVGFAVGKDETKFKLLVGPLNQPRVVDIDFNGKDVQHVQANINWDPYFDSYKRSNIILKEE